MRERDVQWLYDGWDWAFQQHRFERYIFSHNTRDVTTEIDEYIQYKHPTHVPQRTDG